MKTTPTTQIDKANEVLLPRFMKCAREAKSELGNFSITQSGKKLADDMDEPGCQPLENQKAQ
jgi:hypothetical protein